MQMFNRFIKIMTLGTLISFSSLALSAEDVANANRPEPQNGYSDVQKKSTPTINAPYSNQAGQSNSLDDKSKKAKGASINPHNLVRGKKTAKAKGTEIKEEQPEALKTAKSDMITMMFPVNVARAKINLIINVPQSFKPLNAITQQSSIYEFIPKKDKNPNKWSEIITISPLIGKKVTATAYRDSIMNGIKQKAESAEILESKNEDLKNYQEATSIIQYKHEGRDEVMILYVASGPYDLASVQYALPLKASKDLDSAVTKLKAYVQQNVQIQNFN